ncbi:hypothetical protein [Novipirellula artificiosorum]|uniref:Uncharacterized protein n=1 Tax=Novipirellula artificiosorum TaxID=2528016 RepID=A0A5C6DXT2_9BACT|nr:hypothetical protein [Novipirellula artificiosorum]TWU40647.1 hypothetical protein Poly41_14810 [Novipirellula artificiosorum]
MDENQKREEFAKCWLKAEPSISAYVCAPVSSFHDVEEVVQRIALELARRFDEYYGAKEFISKVPELSGQLEIEKHWCNFRLLLNGVRVGKPTSTSSYTWKASEYPELANLQEDWFSLKVIAGAYPQDNAREVSEGARVSFSRFVVTHSDD